MEPMLASGLDSTLPEWASWLAACVGFLGAGCALLCLGALALLSCELRAAFRSGVTAPTTLHAEFMGLGVAKERYRQARRAAAPPAHKGSALPAAVRTVSPRHAH
jgi:hypothetical protein